MSDCTDHVETTTLPERIGRSILRLFVAQGIFVSFIISARHAARDVSFQRGSMLAALEQALTLVSSGMEGVLIRDSSGRSHTPAELSRVLLGARAGAETRTSAARAA